jgi:hypothetical protein
VTEWVTAVVALVLVCVLARGVYLLFLLRQAEFRETLRKHVNADQKD